MFGFANGYGDLLERHTGSSDREFEFIPIQVITIGDLPVRDDGGRIVENGGDDEGFVWMEKFLRG